MVTIKIGGNEMRFPGVSSVDENWINQEINGLKRDGKPVCVRVTLHEGDVNIILTTANCVGNGPGGVRTLTKSEEDAFDLWEKLGLKNGEVSGGKVVAFFKQVRKLVE